LASSRGERSCILTSDPKKNNLCYIAEIKTNTTAIGAAVLTYLMPDDIRFVSEPPSFKNFEPIWQKGVRNPQIAMRRIFEMIRNRQGAYVI